MAFLTNVAPLTFIGSGIPTVLDFPQLDILGKDIRGRENAEELKEWHQHFKYHNKKMDFLTGTTHPINYFIQPRIEVNWGEELSSIYLIKDYETELKRSDFYRNSSIRYIILL